MNPFFVHVLIGAYNKVNPLSLGTLHPDKMSQLTSLSRKRDYGTEYFFLYFPRLTWVLSLFRLFLMLSLIFTD